MKSNRKSGWKRLDNAAKIFPALVSQDDSEVFRISCQLREEVEPDTLQRALDAAIEEFPAFTDTVSRGLFWYYLEDSGKHPQVHEETEPPLQPLYNQNTHGLLIDVSYYRCRINFEVFHAICDGTGALMFFRTLVSAYLCFAHGIPLREIDLGIDTTARERAADSFSQYYEKEKGKGGGLGLHEFLGERSEPAIYQFSEMQTPDFRQLVTEGVISVEAVKRAAHAHGASVTVFLTAQLIASIYDTMDPRDRRKAVSIAIPVNLRNYFASQTVRNFFGIIHVIYDFGQNGAEFADIIAHVKKSFEEELTRENLEKKIAAQVRLERNFGIRMIPLFIKDIAMSISQRVAMRRRTICLSNVGRIEMPAPLVPYIEHFDVFNSSSKRQICLCSFGDDMVISFSGVLAEHDVERAFFRRLARSAAASGAPRTAVTVSTNYFAKEFDAK